MAMSTQQMIGALNDDLAFELSSVIQYLTYAAKVTGPDRPELRRFFLAEVPDETGHAQWLSTKVAAMGGEPETVPHEVAPAGSNREMLEAVFEAEADAVQRYTQRARQAEEMGDKGLQVQLEDMVRQEMTHRDEVDQILRDWGGRASESRPAGVAARTAEPSRRFEVRGRAQESRSRAAERQGTALRRRKRGT